MQPSSHSRDQKTNQNLSKSGNIQSMNQIQKQNHTFMEGAEYENDFRILSMSNKVTFNHEVQSYSGVLKNRNRNIVSLPSTKKVQQLRKSVERNLRKAPDVNDYMGKVKKNSNQPVAGFVIPQSEKHSNMSTIAIPTLLSSGNNGTPNGYAADPIFSNKNRLIKSNGQLLRGPQ